MYSVNLNGSTYMCAPPNVVFECTTEVS